MAYRSVADFLERFVLPLVRGGDMHVARPLATGEIEQFELELANASEALVAVDEARTAVLAEIVVRPPALVLDADELRLAAALHNALFLVHPQASTWSTNSRVYRRVCKVARQLAGQPLSRSRTRVLARHALLHNLFAITRTDLTVSWWSGSVRFQGQSPPKRLIAWRGVRRVREDRTEATFAELLHANESTIPIVAALLRRSPLTQLLASHPQAPSLHWEDALLVMKDPELTRAVAYAALGPPTSPPQLTTPARYAAAFEQMLERRPDPVTVRIASAFLVHLNALLAFAEVDQRDRNARSPLLTTALAPERASKRPRGLTTFLALPNALGQVDPRLAQPPGINEDPYLSQRWEVHRMQVAEGVGEAVIETLAARVARRLDGADEEPEPVEAADQSS